MLDYLTIIIVESRPIEKHKSKNNKSQEKYEERISTDVLNELKAIKQVC